MSFFSLSNNPVWSSSEQQNMKAPLTSYFRNSKQKLVVESLCKFPLINDCAAYSGLLGVLGTGLSLFDIVRVISCGPALPCSLWRTRIETGKIVSASCERDLKLISLVLSLEYYLLLLVGALTQNPVFFLPWLCLYAIIILTEFVIFVCRLLAEGFNISKHGLALTVFVTYNWLTTFCLFYRLILKS